MMPWPSRIARRGLRSELLVTPRIILPQAPPEACFAASGSHVSRAVGGDDNAGLKRVCLDQVHDGQVDRLLVNLLALAREHGVVPELELVDEAVLHQLLRDRTASIHEDVAAVLLAKLGHGRYEFAFEH